MGQFFRNFGKKLGFTQNSTEAERLYGAAALASIGQQFLGADSPAANFAMQSAQGGLQQVAQRQAIADERRRFHQLYGNPSHNIFGREGRFAGASQTAFQRNTVPPGVDQFMASQQPIGYPQSEYMPPAVDRYGLGSPSALGSPMAASAYGTTAAGGATGATPDRTNLINFDLMRARGGSFPPTGEEAPIPIPPGAPERDFIRNYGAETSLSRGRFAPAGPTQGGGTSSTVLGLSPEQVSEVNRVTSFERLNLNDLLRERENITAAYERQRAAIKAEAAAAEDTRAHESRLAKLEGEYKVKEAEIKARQEFLKDREKSLIETQKDINAIMDDLYDPDNMGMEDMAAQAAVQRLESRRAAYPTPEAQARIDAAIEQVINKTTGVAWMDPTTGRFVMKGQPDTGRAAMITSQPLNGEVTRKTAPPSTARRDRQTQALGEVAEVAPGVIKDTFTPFPLRGAGEALEGIHEQASANVKPGLGPGQAVQYLGGAVNALANTEAGKRFLRPGAKGTEISNAADQIATTQAGGLYERAFGRKVRKLETLSPDRAQLIEQYKQAYTSGRINEKRLADIYELVSVQQGLEDLRKLRLQASPAEVKSIVRYMEDLEEKQARLLKRIPGPNQ